MKTTTLTIIAIAALAFGTVNFSKAATVKNEDAVILNNVSKINNIEIYGNVEVYVSDGSADQVKVYNKYYSENALVQSRNGTLRISSYNNEKLVVWVTVNELHSINAYDNAEVRSFGQLSEIGLDVNLHNNSSAKLDLSSYSANVNVSDHAKAYLSGTVNEFDLESTTSTTVNYSQLASEHFTSASKALKDHKTDTEELAGL